MVNVSMDIQQVDSLVQAILALSSDERILLQQKLSDAFSERTAEISLEQGLLQRGCLTPLKQGFPEPSEAFNSGQTHFSTQHDEYSVEQFQTR